MPQIEYKNISKIYETGEQVLNDVSFSIEKGEFLFLVGPSGAGKTSLIKLLIREDMPTEGEIIFDGENIFEISEDLIPDYRRKVGVVFQDFRVMQSKTVFENVAVALEVVDSPIEEIKSIVANVLGLVGLSDKAHKFPKQLSGGEIQRLSIARALAHEPDVLVADEPTGMIDPNASAEVLAVLDEINDRGTTIIMSTHDYNIVNSLKKRVVRIEDGKLVSDKKEGTYNG